MGWDNKTISLYFYYRKKYNKLLDGVIALDSNEEMTLTVFENTPGSGKPYR